MATGQEWVDKGIACIATANELERRGHLSLAKKKYIEGAECFLFHNKTKNPAEKYKKTLQGKINEVLLRAEAISEILRKNPNVDIPLPQPQPQQQQPQQQQQQPIKVMQSPPPPLQQQLPQSQVLIPPPIYTSSPTMPPTLQLHPSRPVQPQYNIAPSTPAMSSNHNNNNNIVNNNNNNNNNTSSSTSSNTSNINNASNSNNGIIVPGGIVRTTTPSPPIPSNVVSAQLQPLQRALLATVQIIYSRYVGSGVVITESGYILSNLHVIANNEKATPIHVAVNPPDFRSPAKIEYTAEVVMCDAALDLVLLKINRRIHSNAANANTTIRLVSAALGDSSHISIGDEVGAIGFPGVGGSTVTYTRGIVAGFMGAFIKTDTEVNHGNSGGAAIDARGALVGITSANALPPPPSANPAAPSTTPDDSLADGKGVGKLGLIRPIEQATKLIQFAYSNS